MKHLRTFSKRKKLRREYRETSFHEHNVNKIKVRYTREQAKEGCIVLF